MKNSISYVLVFLFFCQSIFAQVSINNDGSAPDPSSQLEIKATNKGLLLPRVDPAAVAAPKAGLMLYNNTNDKLSYHNGSSWSNVSTGAGLYERFPNSIGYKGVVGSNATPKYTEYNWTVPATINQIWIEAWAAGFSGQAISSTATQGNGFLGYLGGNAGDYASFLVNVIPNEVINLKVGHGGAGSFNSGGSSQITTGTAPQKSYIISHQQTGINYTIGGTATPEIPGLIQFVGGQRGELSTINFAQSGATEFRRVASGGKGGDCYPAQKGSAGLTVSYDVATGSLLMGGILSTVTFTAPSPGAGGGVAIGTLGANGGAGQIILHW
jgi:hypothetical protein